MCADAETSFDKGAPAYSAAAHHTRTAATVATSYCVASAYVASSYHTAADSLIAEADSRPTTYSLRPSNLLRARLRRTSESDDPMIWPLHFHSLRKSDLSELQRKSGLHDGHPENWQTKVSFAFDVTDNGGPGANDFFSIQFR
jgi:hypothetical protein